MHRLLALSILALLSACAAASGLPLRRVVLHQNGIGYFERRGPVEGETLTMRFAAHEVDDVLGTLTVLDAAGGETVASASVPARVAGEDVVALDLRLPDGRSRDLVVTYAVPVPAWRAVYRVVLPENAGDEAVFQIWALVHNASPEPWDRVALELATNAPFSYAIDLRTPAFVPRPDVTGRLVTPELFGAVMADRGEAPPSTAPSGDSDGDRIADATDACPYDPETYNGTEDEDGCPDRGSVIVSDVGSIMILEKIYFATRSADVGAESLPILDAVAATLLGNPQITSMRVGGHAASNEPDGWALSLARAGAVRAALIERGVPASRLTAEAFAATQPLDPRTTVAAHEANRRVEFFILATADGEVSVPTAITPRAVEGASAALAELRRGEGGARFALASAVSVPARSSTLVTLFSSRVEGAAVLLFRPDPGAPESAVHPFVAGQVRTPEGVTLIPGSVAVYAAGAFVGEGLIEHGEPGELATIPYAIDRTTSVGRGSRTFEEAVRFVSIEGAAARVEDRTVWATTYVIEAGSEVPASLVLSHPRIASASPRGLPLHAETRDDVVVVRLPLTRGVSSTFTIEETQVTTRSVSLVGEVSRSLRGYLGGTTLDDATSARVLMVLERREALALAVTALDALRSQASDAATRTAELRANLAVVRAPELRRNLTRGLDEAAAESARLAAQIETASAEVAEQRVALSVELADLRFVAP
jgi:outer membrane protein OmpA-like peptidoglycan-associated protein